MTPQISWRGPIGSLVCGFFCLAVLTLRAAIPATNGWPEAKVIDMHTHVFNARDLPLVGVLNALGAPRSVAVVAAEVILISTPEDDAEPNFDRLIERVERPVLAQPLSQSQRNVLLDYVGTNRLGPLKLAASYLKVEPDVTLLAATFAQIGFPADDRKVQAAAIKALTEGRALGEALRGYVRFIGLMTKRHPEIVRVLETSYPNTDLFVHHMMDMATAYADESAVNFPDQIKAMQKLDETSKGKLMHFVAYDPFRRARALPWAKTAISSNAAVGLKMYPPTGYRATRNEFPPKPTVWDYWARQRWKESYSGWTEQNLDDNLQGAFAWATAQRVQLFTHCTPHGFPAEKGYGIMADPFYWGVALKKHENAGLWLCFGHSGGEAYWFSDPADDATQTGKAPGDPWQFGRQVVDLCLTYPNVYCEVGYFDPMLDTTKVGVLVRRLQAVLSRHSYTGDWRFGDKLMFGTDWHMIYKEPDYEKYVARWDEVIKAVDKGAWRQAFFAGNAKKFLRLPELAKDLRFTTDQQKEWAALSAAIK